MDMGFTKCSYYEYGFIFQVVGSWADTTFSITLIFSIIADTRNKFCTKMKSFKFTTNLGAYIFFVRLILFELLAQEKGALGPKVLKTIKNVF